MAEPREFYYPLQDDASDIDRVVHDLVEITDTEESVNNYVKIINVEGQPHFSFGPVEDSKPIEVKDWEIPIGDGNDWVKKSDFYITTNKEQFSKDKTAFGEGYHDWGRSDLRYSMTVIITQPDIAGSYNFTPSWVITDLKINGQDFNLSFSDISGFYSIQGQLLSSKYQPHNLFSLNFDDYILADRLFFDSSYNQINTKDSDFNTKFTWGGVVLRLGSDSSKVRGILFFHKDGYIFLCGNFSELPLQFYLQKYHNSNSINTIDVKINTRSVGYKTGVSDLGIAEYSTVGGGGLISINFLAVCPKEVAIGTYGEVASLFFGFNVGAKVGAAEGPYSGGIMLKDSKSTFHLEGNSLLHLRKKSGVLFDNSCVIMSGSPSVVYEGPGPLFPQYGDDRNHGSTWISDPDGPILDMKDKTLLYLGGKSEIALYEGAQIKASGRSSLYLQGTPEVQISGSPTIRVQGNQSPGKISGKFWFLLSNYGISTIELSFIPKDQNEVNEFMNIQEGQSGCYQFLIDIYNREGGTVSNMYPATAPRANAQVTDIRDRNNSLRANGTSHKSSNYCSYDQAKYFNAYTGGQGGNRQAYIMINGGSAVTMQPGDKADPCLLVNGASTILMNNNKQHEYNDYENYYSTPKRTYPCNKTTNGYGPLALFQEDRFYYAGFGSTGAGNNGNPVLADNLTFSKNSLIRNTELEEIIKEVKTKGYADITQEKMQVINNVYVEGRKSELDLSTNYYSTGQDNRVYLTDNFYKIIGYAHCKEYDGAQEQKFFAGNSIVYLGGESGSNSYIRIGADPGEFTEVNILDNSYIETKMNSTLCIRGRDLDNYSWLDIPEDSGGTNIHVLDSATFVMRGVWDDSQATLEDKIPQGADHLTRKNNTTLFEMTDNAEFRMWGNTKFMIKDTGITLKDNSVNDDYTFTVSELKGAMEGGGYTLPVASSNTLGGIKVGSGLAIDANGVLSLDISAVGNTGF